MSNSPVILAAKRTPIGSFLGALANIPAPQLGAQAIRAAIEAAKVSGEDVQECFMGEVLTAGVGQAPARQAAIFAGLPPSVQCMTINKVCGSGLKAVMLAADSIQLGRSQVVVAGGQENMSLAPHILENSRSGVRMGAWQAADTMLKDGLWDPFHNWHMGNAGELCAREYHFTREEQDEFAKKSYEKGLKAQESGLLAKEIVAVQAGDKKAPVQVERDEEPLKARFDKMASLKPAFEKDGTITAANASKINDGAAALIVASERFAAAKNLRPLARIVAQATYAQEPKWFTTAPVGAIKRNLDAAGLSLKDIDLFEINEAFSAVTMATCKELGIPMEKVNVHGGAVALGHPIGASGARILTTLIHALHQHQKRFGLATLCLGGGEAVSIIVERVAS